MTNSGSARTGIQIIATVNAVAAVVTLTFWGGVYLRLFKDPGIMDAVGRASAAATLGFLVSDLVWAVPLLILSVPGLWLRRGWGWHVAQLVNILWAYSMTVVWVRDAYAGAISPGGLVFAPFALFAVWAALYLWRERRTFWVQAPQPEDTTVGDES